MADEEIDQGASFDALTWVGPSGIVERTTEEPSAHSVDASVVALANRYALPTWFANSLVKLLGPRLATRRCTLAARRWRMKIRTLSGRDMTGINDLGTLKFVHDVELGRIWSQERVDTHKDFFKVRPQEAA